LHREPFNLVNAPELLAHSVFLYQVATDLKIENLVLEISFVITPLKKVRLTVQKHCQKPAGSVFRSISLTVLTFSMLIPVVAVSKEPQA